MFVIYSIVYYFFVEILVCMDEYEWEHLTNQDCSTNIDLTIKKYSAFSSSLINNAELVTLCYSDFILAKELLYTLCNNVPVTDTQIFIDAAAQHRSITNV